MAAYLCGPTAAAESDPLIEAGAYVATAADCVACHTRPGGQPFAGGLPFRTRFGVIFSANITPDPVTGVGRWTEVDLKRALREGVSADGRHLYPVFPYPAYAKLSDADIHALYAYLRSLTPVASRPPANAMRFPFGMRVLMVAWNRLFLNTAGFAPDPTRDAEWNRGAYLVQGPGHCGACHTPRNALGAERPSLALTGGVYEDAVKDAVHEQDIVEQDDVVRTWSAPNLTPSPRGLGAWSVDDVAAYLKTGHNERAGAFGPMGEVVSYSTGKLTDDDLRAIGVYLKSLPAAAQTMGRLATLQEMRAGEIGFTVHCADCHQPTGLGVPRTPGADVTKIAPPLADDAVVQAADPATLIDVILYGAHEATANERSWPKMPGFELDFAIGMDDDQIAFIADYVRGSWGNDAGAVDPAQVARQR
jgi:mono/diheme cytochrome c family protein